MPHQIRGITVDALARKAIREANAQINDITNQGQIKGFVKLTQAEYDALVTAGTVDPKIVYLISG